MDETTKSAFLQGVRAELEAFGFEASPEVKELVGEWAASGIALPKPQENSPNTVAHPFTPARESPFPGEGSPEANDGADDGQGEAANDGADDGQGKAANDGADDGQGEAARLDPVERPIVIVSHEYVIVQADDTENDKYYNYTFDYKDKYNSLTTHTLRQNTHTGKNLYQIHPPFRTNSNGSADVEFCWQAVPTTLRPPATQLLA